MPHAVLGVEHNTAGEADYSALVSVACLSAVAARRGAPSYGPGSGRGGRTRVRCRYLLLDRNRGAGALEGSPRLVRGLLVDLLEHGLGRAVNQVLRLLEAEAGQAAHLLDDLDLLLARGLEDDVDLVLLLGLLGLAAAGAARGGGGHGDRGRRLDVKRVLELLHELRELEQGHLLEGIKQVRAADLRHGGSSFIRYWSGGPGLVSLRRLRRLAARLRLRVRPGRPGCLGRLGR